MRLADLLNPPSDLEVELSYVVYETEPIVRFLGHGGLTVRKGQTVADALKDCMSLTSATRGKQALVLTEDEYKSFLSDEERSRWIAAKVGLPYQKFLNVPERALNVVELLADDDCAFDQPCRFGHRVEDHAVYCHNERWVDAPRKCRRTWYTGGKVRDEDCPGYEPNDARPS